MHSCSLATAVAFLVLCLVTGAWAGEETTYHGQIEPIVRERCAGCHGGESPKGRLDLSTFESLNAGGKRGPAVVPGNPEKSLLYLLTSGARKPRMPPEKEGPLREEEVAAIRAWIEGGCRKGEPPPEVAPYSRPLEPPVYPRPSAVRALIYSRDGGSLFVAGYREVLVHAAEAAPGGGDLPRARLLGEAEQITALALSPDGGHLLAVGGSPARFGELQLWDTRSLKLVRFERMGKDTLFAAAFSPSGDRLAVAGTDRALHVLEVASGKRVYSSEVHSDWVFGVAFSADGAHIASAGRDKTVKVSAAPSGDFLQNLATLGGAVMRVVAVPGTSLFLAGGDTAKPLLLDTKEMKQAAELEAQPGAILAVASSADGKLLAVGGAFSEARVYQTDNRSRKSALKLPEIWVYALAFRPDGQALAVAGHDGVVRVFDIKDGKEIRTFVPMPIGRLRSF